MISSKEKKKQQRKSSWAYLTSQQRDQLWETMYSDEEEDEEYRGAIYEGGVAGQCLLMI